MSRRFFTELKSDEDVTTLSNEFLHPNEIDISNIEFTAPSNTLTLTPPLLRLTKIKRQTQDPFVKAFLDSL